MLAELSRYFVASGLALAADLAAFWLLLRLGALWPVAAAWGFAAGLGVVYLLSVRWAFASRRLRQPAVEFAVFAAIGVCGLGLTEAGLWLCIVRLGMPPVLAKLATAIAVFLFNFGCRKAILFTRGAATRRPFALTRGALP